MDPVVNPPSNLGRLAGLLAYLPFLPISTVTNLAQDKGWRGAGAGAVTDVGRGLGSLAGMALLPNVLPQALSRSPGGRFAGYLGSQLVGGFAGQEAGRTVGNSLFSPKRASMKTLDSVTLLEMAKAASFLDAFKKDPHEGMTGFGGGVGMMMGGMHGGRHPFLNEVTEQSTTMHRGPISRIFELKSQLPTGEAVTRLPAYEKVIHPGGGVAKTLSKVVKPNIPASVILGMLLGGGAGALGGKGVDLLRDRMN